MFRILSLDGGGVRGILTANLLNLLEKERSFLNRIDLISGTSTGAILALALANDIPIQKLIELYRNLGPQVFAKAEARDGFSQACYDHRQLYELLRRVLFPGDPTLADLNKYVVIPVFQLWNEEVEKWKTVYFCNFDKEEAKNHLLADVALRSAAAPVYFPSFQGYIDGGVAANNPSMIALARTLDRGKRNLEELSILSIGTGSDHNGVHEDVNWGVQQWVVKGEKGSPRHPLLSIIWDGVSDIPDYQCKQILKERYFRLSPRIPQPIFLDDFQKVEELMTIAHNFPQEHPEEWKRVLKFIA